MEQENIKHLSTIEKIDLVLETIYNETSSISALRRPTYGDISKIISPQNTDITVSDIEISIAKLIKDGYIKSEDVIHYKNAWDSNPETHIGYSITFEGKLFKELGSYQGMQEDRNREKQALERQQSEISSLTIRQTEYAKNMVLLTRWIAFGAIVASIYYLIGILSFLNHHFPCLFGK